MESLVELRSDGVSKLSQQDNELAETIKDSLLVNADLDVVAAAARALGALGVQNGRLVFGDFTLKMMTSVLNLMIFALKMMRVLY